MDVLCNSDAAPDWLADLYRTWRKLANLGVDAEAKYRADLVYCLRCLTLEEFSRSGFALGFDSPVVGGKVWFVADNYDYGGELDGVSYRAGELARLLGAAPEDLRLVHSAKSVFSGEVVDEVEEEADWFDATDRLERLLEPEGPKVDLSPRDPKLVSRVRVALGRLAGDVASCRRCGLARTRTRVVVGEGDPGARIMVVGEAPGRQEDATGRPFVGKAGRLLDRLLTLAGLRRQGVYIANVVKCRPTTAEGRNRAPSSEEIAACAGFLRTQLALVSPALVVTLGATALEWFLPGFRVGEARGRLFEADGWLVYPTYHPAAALWEEGDRAMRAMEEDFANLGEMLRGCE